MQRVLSAPHRVRLVPDVEFYLKWKSLLVGSVVWSKSIKQEAAGGGGCMHRDTFNPSPGCFGTSLLFPQTTRRRRRRSFTSFSSPYATQLRPHHPVGSNWFPSCAESQLTRPLRGCWEASRESQLGGGERSTWPSFGGDPGVTGR